MRGLPPLRFLLLGLFVVAMTACGSGDEAGQPTIPPAPTATSVPPAAAPDRTATAVSEPPVLGAVLEGLLTRPFPDELVLDSERLSAANVEAIYTEYLGGVRTVQFGGQTIFDTCSDGTGAIVKDVVAAYSGEPFTWGVEKDRGGRWNQVVLSAFFGPGGPIDTTIRWTVSVPKEGELRTERYAGSTEEQVLESPDCD